MLSNSSHRDELNRRDFHSSSGIIPRDEEEKQHVIMTNSNARDDDDAHLRVKSQFSDVFRVPTMSNLLKNAVPMLMIVLIGYLEYCYCYRFCYGKLYAEGQSKGCGITFCIIFDCFLVVSFILWAQILLVGPGSLNIKIPPYDLSSHLNCGGDDGGGEFFDDNDGKLIEPPDWFLCDRNGLPFWCSECQSIKILRSHHSNETGECIPHFDHYCIYIRSVIGIKNYKLFIQFLIVMYLWLTFIFITSCCFVHNVRDYKGVHGRLILNPNFILMLIVSIFWMIMTGALLVSHLILIKKNLTTVESMQVDNNRKRSRSDRQQRFINFKNPLDSTKRIVMQLDSKQLLYDSGFSNNVHDLLGTQGWSLFIPFNTNCSDVAKSPRSIYMKTGLNGLVELENNSYSGKFKDCILEKFANGEGREFGKFQMTHDTQET